MTTCKALCLVALAAVPCSVIGAPSLVVVRGPLSSVSYDLRSGRYTIRSVKDPSACLSDAACSLDSADVKAVGPRMARVVPARDALGTGRKLTVLTPLAGRRELRFEATVYDRRGAVGLRLGLANRGSLPYRMRAWSPLAGARLCPGAGVPLMARTLDGAGGAGDTRVLPGLMRRSPNNLLATFTASGRRRSVVLGGLAYRDWLRFAAVGPDRGLGDARRRALARAPFPGARLAAYLDCGREAEDATASGPSIRVAEGTPFTWSEASIAAAGSFGSVVFGDRQVAFSLSGLRADRRYVLGISWWDFDGNGRVEGVRIASGGREWPLIDHAALPRWRGKSQSPQERAVPVPAEATQPGSARVIVANQAAVPNAVVSEIWLWECDRAPSIPAGWSAGRPAQASAPSAGKVAFADVYAEDPVGRWVEPGEAYLPPDTSYVDVTTPDPFDALEQYGRALRAVAPRKPNPYTFPTVCAWYVGLFEWPQAANRPEASKYGIAATPGTVEEARRIRECGFLDYAPAAVRLVPDTYAANNEQGWWDDAHWLGFRHYAPPYATSAEWGRGMRREGVFPFTYFQLGNDSVDFRTANPGMMLGRNPTRTLDYSSPLAQAHMRKVYANLRAAGVRGMMFDYPDSVWAGHLAQGGFADRTATAASAYRSIFSLAKEGLGPGSWIHERVLGDPLSDITIGHADSQRVWGDTNAVEPTMISRCGLRWYKNRVVMSYDMDAKNVLQGWRSPGYRGSDADGRRMLLTMAHVAASRLLLSTSFRDMPPATLHDLERTFPYPSQPLSARPVDAFIAKGWPRVYDLPVSADWRQVTLFNVSEPSVPARITAPLSGDRAGGALGLVGGPWHLYDFWNDRYVGCVPAGGSIDQVLRPGEARMLSVRRVMSRPQVISTNRHILQGYLDLVGDPSWDPRSGTLSGRSRVVAGDRYEVVIAGNGRRARASQVSQGAASLRQEGAITRLRVDAAASGIVSWQVRFGGRS